MSKLIQIFAFAPTLIMFGCSTTHSVLYDTDVNRYPTYNPACTRFVQHVSLPQKFNSVESYEKSNIAKECKSGY